MSSTYMHKGLLCMASLLVFCLTLSFLSANTDSSNVWFPLPTTNSTEIQKDRERKRDRQWKKKPRLDRAQRRERRSRTDSYCLCFCLCLCLRSCPLEIRPNDRMRNSNRRPQHRKLKYFFIKRFMFFHSCLN